MTNAPVGRKKAKMRNDKNADFPDKMLETGITTATLGTLDISGGYSGSLKMVFCRCRPGESVSPNRVVNVPLFCRCWPVRWPTLLIGVGRDIQNNGAQAY